MKFSHMLIVALVVLIIGFVASIRLSTKDADLPPIKDIVGSIQNVTPSNNPSSLTPEEKAQIDSFKDKVILGSPAPLDEVSLPFDLAGRATGTWFFEGSFPIELVDEKGVVIAETIGQSTSDWMTTDFVPFKATLGTSTVKSAQSTTTTVSRAYILLRKDNPSGEAVNDRTVSIPVLLRR